LQSADRAGERSSPDPGDSPACPRGPWPSPGTGRTGRQARAAAAMPAWAVPREWLSGSDPAQIVRLRHVRRAVAAGPCLAAAAAGW